MRRFGVKQSAIGLGILIKFKKQRLAKSYIKGERFALHQFVGDLTRDL
jgi:hypothetical protein